MAERVLIVHAHPDAETVWTGATIARLRRDGVAVTVLTATRGERATLVDGAPPLGDGPDAMGERRATELAEAMRVLGVSDHRFLGDAGARWRPLPPRRYRDSGVAWGSSGPVAAPDAGPDALGAADSAEIALDIAAVISDVRPDFVITVGPRGIDGHPDRRRIHETTRWAAESLRVPLFVLSEPGGIPTTIVGDPESLAARAAALEAYRSTLVRRSDTFSFASGAPHRLDEREGFSRYRAPATTFDGYGRAGRILAGVLAFVLGAATGLVLTIAHQAVIVVAGVPVPWGLIAGLVLATALLAGLRVVYGTRIIAGAATIGLLGAVAWLSLSTPTGSVLVPDNLAGQVWTIGVVLVAAIVLAWPRFDRARGGRMKSPAAKGSDQP
jgi:N-acetyl-1-D-myo-inositol-2-amino-2-deoxy-alpha-D-glucopyranoside deacetylase